MLSKQPLGLLHITFYSQTALGPYLMLLFLNSALGPGNDKHFQYLLAFSQIQGCDSSQRVPKALQPFNYSKLSFNLTKPLSKAFSLSPLERRQEDMIHVRIRGS